MTVEQSIRVNARAYMELLHQLRSFRDQETAVSQWPGVQLRQGVIVARYPSTKRVDVQLAGSDRALDGPADPCFDVPLADGVYPKVGAACFVALMGASPVVLYTVGVAKGRCSVTRTSNKTVVPATVTPVDFDTELEDTDGLWTGGTPTRVTIPWPGSWLFTGAAQSAGGATAGVRRYADLRLGGTTIISRQELPSIAPPNSQGHLLSRRRRCDQGDYVELTLFQNGSGNLDFSGAPGAEYTLTLDAEWLGP